MFEAAAAVEKGSNASALSEKEGSEEAEAEDEGNEEDEDDQIRIELIGRRFDYCIEQKAEKSIPVESRISELPRNRDVVLRRRPR